MLGMVGTKMLPSHHRWSRSCIRYQTGFVRIWIFGNYRWRFQQRGMRGHCGRCCRTENEGIQIVVSVQVWMIVISCSTRSLLWWRRQTRDRSRVPLGCKGVSVANLMIYRGFEENKRRTCDGKEQSPLECDKRFSCRWQKLKEG